MRLAHTDAPQSPRFRGGEAVPPHPPPESRRLRQRQGVPGALNELKMAYPKATAKRRRELKCLAKGSENHTTHMEPRTVNK